MTDGTEEERYIQTKESVIINLYANREIEKQYLKTVNKLLNYWTDELRKADFKDKERQNRLLDLIKREKDTIKKINEDIDRINELIDKIEKNG